MPQFHCYQAFLRLLHRMKMTKEDPPANEAPSPAGSPPAPARRERSIWKRKRRSAPSEAGPSRSRRSLAPSSVSPSVTDERSPDRRFPLPMWLFRKGTTPRRRPLRKPPLKRAEPGSLNHLVHVNARTRLFVEGLLWSTDQLQLLQCRIEPARFEVSPFTPFPISVLVSYGPDDPPPIPEALLRQYRNDCVNFADACGAISNGSTAICHVMSILRLFGGDVVM